MRSSGVKLAEVEDGRMDPGTELMEEGEGRIRWGCMYLCMVMLETMEADDYGLERKRK